LYRYTVASSANIKFNMHGLVTDEAGIAASMTTFCRPEVGRQYKLNPVEPQLDS
jgi:hypothetical protein